MSEPAAKEQALASALASLDSVIVAYSGGVDSAYLAYIASRTLAIDILNRSLLSDFLPFQGLRGLGLYALDRIGPLRRAVMREGIAPSAATPLLMHREA